MISIYYRKLRNEDDFEELTEISNLVEINDKDDLTNLLGNYDNHFITDSDFTEFLEGLVEERIESHRNPEKIAKNIMNVLEELLHSCYQYL